MVDLHLCQPDNSKSCAACCGIYNYSENTRSSLEKRFIYRSQLFKQVRDDKLSLEDYKTAIRHRENAKRIYTTIYTCEFVGFVDEDRQRVGCMLHPILNNGKDLRTISFYGRDICEGHFCPSYQKLDRHEVEIILAALDDWYLYGSIITDIDFVKTFFRLIHDRLGETLKPDRVRPNHRLLDIIQRYCSLKVDWPFCDTSRPRFGKYYFVGEEYDIARIDYASLGAEIPPYDAIFLSLSSMFKNKEELDKACQMIDALIEEFCCEYRSFNR